LKARLVKYAFFLVLIADITIRLLALNEIDRFLKPLLMPLLLYYLIEKTEGNIYKNHLFLAGALVAAWIGDILLLNQGDLFLIGGIAVFLLTQTIYLFIFKSNTSDSIGTLLQKHRTISIIAVVLFSGFLTLAILNIEFPMILAVLFYGMVVTLATLFAFFQKNTLSGYEEMRWGMSIFLLSDALLATNMFFFILPLAPMLIIGTYGIAQYWITEGIAKSAKESAID